MMSQSQLTKDPRTLDGEHELEYYENICEDMLHDKSLKIDLRDYRDDIETYWGLKTLNLNHMHLLYAFYGFVSLALGYFDYINLGQHLSLSNLFMMIGGVILFAISIKIYDAQPRHKQDFLNYRKKRLINS